jgi:hypothetical protein
MPSCGMLRRVDLIRTGVSEERSVSIIRWTIMGELGTTLAVTKNRGTLREILVVPRSPILVTLMMEALRPTETRLLQETRGVRSQKTAFFVVTAARTSNLELSCSVEVNCNMCSVKYEILTAIALNVIVFWHVTQCRLVDRYRRFGRMLFPFSLLSSVPCCEDRGST